MSQYDTDCLVCSHRDHFYCLPYEDEVICRPMCWDSKAKEWIITCPCRNHVSSTLEYIETIYDAQQKNPKRKKF